MTTWRLSRPRSRPSVNPVLERELRQRLRTRSAWMALTLYLVILGLILRLVYDVVSDVQSFDFGGQFQQASTAGRSIFHWLLFVMLGLICFIIPGLTAGAIAGERERQTLIPLQITLLSARSIVVGKLLASLAFVVLLVIAALPFMSVSFLLGGVSAVEVMKGTAMVLVVAVAIAAVSLAASAALRRTQTATVTAYGLVVFLVLGTTVIYTAQRAFDRSFTGTTSPIVLVLNPFAATAEVVRGRTLDDNLTSPFTGIQSVLEREVFTDGGFVDEGFEGPFPDGPFPVPVPAPLMVPAAPATTVPGDATAAVPGPVVEVRPAPAGATGSVAIDGPLPQGVAQRFAQAEDLDRRPRVAGMPFWFASLLTFAALTAVALVIAVRRVRVPARGRAE